jgi:hypothetical protein
MKHKFSIFLIILCYSEYISFGNSCFTGYSQLADTILQRIPLNQKSYPDSVLVKFTVVKEDDGSFMKGIAVYLYNPTTKKLYKTFCNSQGMCRLLVPPAKNYKIGIEDVANFSNCEIKYEPGPVFDRIIRFTPTAIKEEILNDTIHQYLKPFQEPTSSRVLLNVKLINYDNIPDKNENVYINIDKETKVYHAVTDETGRAVFLLPKEKLYSVNFDMERDVQALDYRNIETNHATTLNYKYVGTKELIKRKTEKERLIRERDSLYELEIKNKPDLGESDFLEQIHFGTKKDKVIKRMEDRALKEKAELAKDPKFFEKARRPINAVLYRLQNQWKNKVIVADITGSMYPYMDQILIWFLLKSADEDKNKYLFFNDGDNKPDIGKIIGRTGGIYFTPGKTVDELFSTMITTMKAGNGGDTPENNIEALLEGLKKCTGNAELIMIADNYSDVKDIALLTKLNVPVRIILCGTDCGINEDYLQIAYKTGGSVHTIEQDIYNLTQYKEGSVITIENKKYRFNRGKFVIEK